MRIPLGSLVFLLLLTVAVFAQTPSPQETNPQALAQLTQAIVTFWGTETPQSIELDGAIISHVPPGQSGHAVIRVESSGRSTFESDFGSEKHVATTSTPDDHSGCQQTGTDGVLHQRAIHNCFLAANPLFPLVTLSSHLSDSTISFQDKGGSSIQVSFPLADADPGALPLLKHLSMMLITFDPQTHLPVTVDYSEHPEKSAKADISAEIQYSDYRSVSGAMIPYSIQKYLNGTLVFEIHADKVTFYSSSN